ncbi:hypothetical protein Tco_1139018, partial [Tanacetum coccineum]
GAMNADHAIVQPTTIEFKVQLLLLLQSVNKGSVMENLSLACIQKLERDELVSHRHERLHRLRFEMQQIESCLKRAIDGPLS